MKKLYKNFIFDIIIAVIALALGVVMLPPFGIGQQALNILMAITLAAYLAIYTFDKIRRSKGAILVLTLVEFCIITVIALALVIQQFSPLKISGVCRIIGVVLWLRGVFSALGMYILASSAKRQKYGVIRFLICALLSAFGVYLFAAPIITDLALTWIICITFFACALIFGALGILFSPMRRKSRTDS